MKKIDLSPLLLSSRHLLPLLLLPLLFALTTLTANAQCRAPNCAGGAGYDIKTGQGSAKVNYGSQNAAWNAVKKECPDCKGVMFSNGCAAVVYSASHNFITWGTAWEIGDATTYAKNKCWADIRKIGLDKTKNDRRHSNRRTDEQGRCEVVASACTYREEIYWY